MLDFSEIAEDLRRITVLVRDGRRGAGSGVMWAAGGLVITNAHVASGSQVYVKMWDGSEWPAQIERRDLRLDLAALRLPARGMPAAAVADSSTLRAGQLAIAVGNPLGWSGALAAGLIHAVGPAPGLGEQAADGARASNSGLPRPGSKALRWVQSTVRLAPGNSGGPLADAAGRVVGINTMVVGGLALSIPSNTVLRFLSTGADRAWLGVTVRPVRLLLGRELSFGLLVEEVTARGPAAGALIGGDVLLAADSQRLRGIGDLEQALGMNGGAPRLLHLEVLRMATGRAEHVTVDLGGRTAAA